jgi:hypothetical protein
LFSLLIKQLLFQKVLHLKFFLIRWFAPGET